jgi:hypothetical protein
VKEKGTVLAVHLQPDAVRRRVRLLTEKHQVALERHLAVHRYNRPIAAQRRQRPVGRVTRTVGGQIDHPQPWPRCRAAGSGLCQSQFSGEQLPAEERVAVGPAELLVIAEQDDLAVALLAAFEDAPGALDCLGPVAAASGRRHVAQALADARVIDAQFTHHADDLLLGLEDGNRIAGGQFVEQGQGPRARLLEGRPAARLVGGGHAGGGVKDEDDVPAAARPQAGGQ